MEYRRTEGPTPEYEFIGMKGLLSIFFCLSVVLFPMCLVMKLPGMYILFGCFAAICVAIYLRLDKLAQEQANALKRMPLDELVKQMNFLDNRVRDKVIAMMPKH